MKIKITKRIIDFCERNDIATEEVLKLFFAAMIFYILVLIAWRANEYYLETALSLMTVGGLGNLYVILFNNNKMPVPLASRTIGVMRKKYPKRGICKLTKKTKLPWLSDKYLLRFWKWNFCYASMGDFAVAAGFILIVTKPFIGA